MQHNKKDLVKKILLALASLYNVKGLKGVAGYLGVPKTQVYGWVRNGNITETGIILAKSPDINREWLKTGEGRMLLVEVESGVELSGTIAPETPEEKPIRTYKGNRTKSVGIGWRNGQKGEGAATSGEDFSLADMMADAEYVLESKTVYRLALAANIRAFKQAVVNEDTMKNTDRKIDEMMKQIETLTNIVLQGQGVEAEKKRAV